MANLSCRFYEHKYPEIDDVVMVTVKSIAEMGAYVHLLEYNKIEGMILLSELSRRRIRSINKLIRVGRDECVVVIRVDKEKGYIDLSKRRVSPEDVLKCEEKFANAKCVNSILIHTARTLNLNEKQLEELYSKTAWYFDNNSSNYGASYDAFKSAVNNPKVLEECDVDDKVRDVLLSNIKLRLTPQSVKIRADIEVSCYQYDGVDAVKESLREGLKLSDDEFPIKINLIAPPQYVVTTTTLDKINGVKKVETVLAEIKNKIEESRGVFTIKMQPKVVSEAEEQELEEQMKKLTLQNEEKSGDDDDEEEEEEDDEEEEKGKVEKVEDGDGKGQKEGEGEGEGDGVIDGKKKNNIEINNHN